VIEMRGRIVVLTAGVAVSAVVAYRLAYIPWRQRWQASQEESAKSLPGDELVPDADLNQTLAVTIDAPRSAVWPWLLQMGYGRGGWYSYDAIDMLGHSTYELRAELQAPHVGELIPFAPKMGFRVEVVEPDRALVLYADDKLAKQGQRAGRETSDAEPTEEAAAGIKMTGLLAQANMTEFQVSWAFVLDPLEGGRTRLLERFRTRTTPGPAAAITGPVIGHGHFLMTRKHMLGIKERAESIAATAPHQAAEGIADTVS
jgi:hypothetical protein